MQTCIYGHILEHQQSIAMIDEARRMVAMAIEDRWTLTCLVVGIEGPLLCSACTVGDCWIILNLMCLLYMSFWNFLFECGLHFLLDLLVLIFKFQTTRLVGVVFSSFSSFYPEEKLDICIDTYRAIHKKDCEKGHFTQRKQNTKMNGDMRSIRIIDT